jgi:crotonobetainyl-CoA:carnitine CoA-transferase CaiB-like acyl-CoA transferase
MKPLEGLRILAIEQFGAGPYGTTFLADLGAEVIKIENAASGGDPARYTGPRLLGAADSEYFQSWNSGKHSIVLDLKSQAGREALEALVAESDAVVNNLRGDQPEKLKIDYASLQSLNPAIVCLHISAYGRDNERKTWPGYDYLMQAEAGLMSITGEPGKGCDVDTCLFDVALHQLGYTATWFLNNGDVTERMPRSSHFSVAPVQTFPTADGWIFVMCMTEKFWTNLTADLGRNDLLEDARFASPEARRLNREALSAVLDDEFRKATTQDWLQRLSGKLPVGPVYNLRQALENPFVARSGMIRTVAHPANPELKLLSSPLRVDGVRPNSPVCASLGADNETFVTTRKYAAVDR